ncbi:MAG: cysteine--tRNA ligase [SAR324 cluster bacterium]|nr:cysteine--tRNA ligase [SAR324 cluster bacterium]MBL7034321.1 cysteine--tRNA ligase [SAR324 cluster bacterium]
MPLKIYNTLTGQKEPFNPVHEGQASLYVCGPTVYGDSHLGHAKAYVSFDVVLRYLRYSGLKTFYVQNITDVGHLLGDGDEGEDKMLKRARELEQEPMAVAESFARRHFEAMDRLDVIRPDISPRATGHIPEQLEAIENLLEQGLAYESNGSVYFEISKDPKYGELSNRKVEEMQGGARVKVRAEKRHPGDFALWKRAEPGHLMRWRDSFSGWGYPGWHTECVVMSTRYLGAEFDIHGGGMDLKFPHHECEIAQARGLKKPFARNWMHTNMLTINGQKMSKSSGNFVTLFDVFEQYDPLTVRYFIAASHYRSVVDFSENALAAAEISLKRLQQTVRNLRECKEAGVTPSGKYFEEFRRRFRLAMDDDFSTPQAFAALFDLSREVNTLLAEKKPDPEAIADADHLFSTLGGDVLGIIPAELEDVRPDLRMNEVLQVLIELRADFRKNKDFESADLVRDRLQKIGIVFRDSPEGTTWEMTDNK